MTLSRSAALVLAAAILALPGLAAAQEPVRDFTQLNTRLRPGDTVWVTDAQGREVKGRIASLSGDALTLEGGSSKSFGSADVTTIALRRDDSLRNGALIGLVVGGGLAAAGCIAEAGYTDSFCPAYILLYPAMGVGIGVGIDALIPGKKIVAYRGPGSGGASSTRLSVAPFVTPHAKGVAVSIGF